MPKAHALYDFFAQPDSNELSIKAGDILDVVREDVGDGWWEGVNANGERGLFPVSYVEIIPDATNGTGAAAGGPPPPCAPPPPLPDEYHHQQQQDQVGARSSVTSSYHSQYQQHQQSSGWGDDLVSSGHAPPPPPAGVTHHSSGGAGDFDDDWSDDDSQAGNDGQAGYNQISSAIGSNIPSDAGISRARDGRGGSSVKKSMNRFSPFVKGGTESFLLNAAKLTQKPSETIEIVMTKDGPEWAPADVYSCSIASRQKSSKLHGLKSFITYQLTPSLNNLQVSRRYKHFDWLYNRLQEKFTIIFIPPLPEKQVTGRYEDEFVEHRMHLLQLWVNKICRHPILSKSDVWMHFITCTDEKEWKKGKRKAEKDEYSGGLLFYTIQAPNQTIDQNDFEQQIESFGKCSRLLEDSVRNFQSVASDNAKRMVGPFKREFTKLAVAIRSLGGAFEADQSNPKTRQLATAMNKTASCYDHIGRLYEEQPKMDSVPLLNELFIYKGMLNGVPDMLQVHKSALSKYRESQRACEEGRVSASETDAVRQRVDTINYATLAEINNFQRERLVDFNEMMNRYIHAQINFYQLIVDSLKEAAQKFVEQ